MVMGVRMVKHHWDGIINAATNAIAESINAKIQRIKRAAYGYRNHERFIHDIPFHCGGIDIYPETTRHMKGRNVHN